MATRDDQPRPLAPAPATGDLLTQVARGDEAAFAKLYDELAPRVYGLCRRIVRDPAQAEEVAQEALVEVWRTAGRYDPAKGSASAWVHRGAVGVAEQGRRRGTGAARPRYRQGVPAVAGQRTRASERRG